MIARLLVCAVLAGLIVGGLAYVGDCTPTATAATKKKVVKKKKIRQCEARCAALAHRRFEICRDEGGLANECAALARAARDACRERCDGR